MKLRSLLASFAIVVAAIVGASIYAQPPGGGGPGGQPKTDLAKKMDIISESQKSLNNLPITDPAKKTEALATLETMKAALLDAAKLTPAYLAQQPEENKKKFMDDFKAQQAKIQVALDATIAAVKAGNAADITKNWTNVDDIHNESHKEFKAPRGNRGGGGGGGGAPGGGAPRGQ